jgi:hypothetical protein
MPIFIGIFKILIEILYDVILTESFVNPGDDPLEQLPANEISDDDDHQPGMC